MAATAAAGPPGMPWSTGSIRPARASPAAPAKASAGRARWRSAGARSWRRGPTGCSVHGAGPSSSQARQAPARASRNVSSGAPPIATQRAVGALAWLIASLPQGKAYGQRSRIASAATHQPATATGQARSCSSRRWPTASTAKLTISAAARAAQTYQATLTSQEISGTKNAAPNTSPTARLARRLLRHSATVSSAGPPIASGQAPAGGKAAARARPPASATGSAQRSGMPPRAGPGREPPACSAAAAGASAVTPGPAALPPARPPAPISRTAPPRTPFQILVRSSERNRDPGRRRRRNPPYRVTSALRPRGRHMVIYLLPGLSAAQRHRQVPYQHQGRGAVRLGAPSGGLTLRDRASTLVPAHSRPPVRHEG